MWQYAFKIIVTAVLVVAILETAKRSTLMGAIIASLPVTSILAMIWLYLDTKNIEQVSALSQGVFWVVIPSLVFFALFPVLTIKVGWSFWPSLGTSMVCTAASYWGYIEALKKFNIEI